MINLSSGWDKSGPFLPKPGHFFEFQKKGTAGLPPTPPHPSYTPDMKDFYSRIMEEYF